jgi:hypothetical protein
MSSTNTVNYDIRYRKCADQIEEILELLQGCTVTKSDFGFSIRVQCPEDFDIKKALSGFNLIVEREKFYRVSRGV